MGCRDSSICTAAVKGILPLTAEAIGSASLITSEDFQAQTISVVVGFLPNPAKLGERIDGYSFLLVDSQSGVVVVNQSMVYLPAGEGTWAGSASIQLEQGHYPKGLVLVFGSRSKSGVLGPQVAAGNLADCRDA